MRGAERRRPACLGVARDRRRQAAQPSLGDARRSRKAHCVPPRDGGHRPGGRTAWRRPTLTQASPATAATLHRVRCPDPTPSSRPRPRGSTSASPPTRFGARSVAMRPSSSPGEPHCDRPEPTIESSQWAHQRSDQGPGLAVAVARRVTAATHASRCQLSATEAKTDRLGPIAQANPAKRLRFPGPLQRRGMRTSKRGPISSTDPEDAHAQSQALGRSCRRASAAHEALNRAQLYRQTRWHSALESAPTDLMGPTPSSPQWIAHG